MSQRCLPNSWLAQSKDQSCLATEKLKLFMIKLLQVSASIMDQCMQFRYTFNIYRIFKVYVNSSG